MPKTKLSVTVDSPLLLEVERMAGGSSRSKVVESALAGWLRGRRREKLEEEVEVYYRSLGVDEKKEDADWAELSGRGLRESWR